MQISCTKLICSQDDKDDGNEANETSSSPSSASVSSQSSSESDAAPNLETIVSNNSNSVNVNQNVSEAPVLYSSNGIISFSDLPDQKSSVSKFNLKKRFTKSSENLQTDAGVFESKSTKKKIKSKKQRVDGDTSNTSSQASSSSKKKKSCIIL